MELFILETIVSILAFANKVFVYLGRRIGWLLGVVSASVAITYLFIVHIYLIMILQVGLIVLMGNRYVFETRGKKLDERIINLFTISIILTLGIITFAGLMTVVEFIGAVGILMGTWYLTGRGVKFGWLLWVIGHTAIVVISIFKQQFIFAFFQGLSIFVALAGLVKAIKLPNKNRLSSLR